ncbi:MAG: hypothetical protein DRP89_05570 [Candidatus Neomarinimicrobiota bacterium]|nr:MAG: hypothetical protein DRP89_05570 [Candidatus Neomarinimicrobiota bacterium]
MVSERDKAKETVENIVKEFGCYLLDFSINRYGSRTFIKVVAESDTEITIQQIAEITKSIKRDEKFDNLFPSGFQLEVTSAGVNFHLKDRRDFVRNIGRKLKIFYNRPDIKSPIVGQLLEVTGSSLSISVSGDLREIDLDDIKYGKVVLEW